MRNFFSVIIIFAVLVVAGGYLYMQKQEEATRLEMEQNLASVRRSFAHKARDAVNELESDRYLRSMKSAITSYDDELKRTVYKPHPDARDPDAYKKKVEEQFKEKKIDEKQHKSMIEGHQLVRDAYDVLMGAQWQPVLTAKGSGDTRIDIYTLKRGQTEDGQPVLEGNFFFWGIEDSTQVTWGELSMRVWKMEKEMVKEGGKSVEKEVEKVLGKVQGEAQPRIIIQRPNKYIDDFPAFVSVGHIWLPILPPDAVFVDIDYTYGTRTGGGGEVESSIKWEKLPVPSGWKLEAGQKWNADVVEATDDEIAGKKEEAEKAEGAN